MDKYVLIYQIGLWADAFVEQKSFKTLQEMVTYINNENIVNLEGFNLIFCGEVHRQFKFQPKEVISKIELV